MAVGLVAALIVGVLVAAPVSAEELGQVDDAGADEVVPVAELRAVGEASSRAAGGPSSVVSLVPARVLETRAGRPTADGQFEGIGRRSARQVTEVDVLGRVGVPAEGVEAVVMNATATGAVQRGFLTVFPCGERPEASSVNHEAGGPAVANEVIAKVSDEGTVCVFNQRDLDIVLDVVGYIGAADTETRAAGEASSVVSLVPARVLETRADRPTADGLFEGIGRRSARQVTEVDVLDRVGVPAEGVEAVVMNATAIGALQRGFLTVFPCGERPEASSVNYEAGGPAVANEVIAKVSDDGTVCVFNQRDLDIVLDVVGYIGAADSETRAAGEPSSVVSLVPARVLETRADRPTADGQFEGIGRRSAQQVTEVDVLDRVGVPAEGVEAVVMNATAIGALQRGFLTVFPCGERPEASSVNYEAGGPAVANEVIAKVSDAGTVCVFNQRDLDIVLDVVGYISSIPAPTDPPPVDPPPVDPPPPPPPDGDVVVPDVVGLQQGPAIERIVDETLTPGLGGSRHDDAPAGEVIEQAPIGGSRVDEGDDVAFVLSLGPELVTVPDVLGDDEATARGKIEAAGLTVGDVGAGESDDYDVGDVNLQLPLAGQEVLPGTPVDVTLTTGLVNDPPEITTNPVTEHTVGSEYVYDVDATDPESDPTTFVLQAGPLDDQGDPLATINPTTGVLTWTPTTDDAGAVDFAIRAEDGNGGIDVQSFTLNITLPNAAPGAVDDVVSATFGESLVIGATILENDTDPDNDDLDITNFTQPQSGQLSGAGETLTYTPNEPVSSTTVASDVELTEVQPVVVTSDKLTNPSFPVERLNDGVTFSDWFTSGSSQGPPITLSFDFDVDVALARVDVFGSRQFGEEGYEVQEFTIRALDASAAELFTADVVADPDSSPGDDVDADTSFDLVPLNGGELISGVRTVEIVITQVGSQGYPGLSEIDLYGDAPVALFAPQLEWSVLDIGSQTVPLVADLDRDGTPEVVYNTLNGELRARRGDSGAVAWTRPEAGAGESGTEQYGTPVIADFVDNPGLEVVHPADDSSVLRAVGADGSVLEEFDTALDFREGNLAAADVDADGQPEIVGGGNDRVGVFNIDPVTAEISERWVSPNSSGCGRNQTWPYCTPVVVDVDLDGQLEVITGSTSFDAASGVLEQEARNIGGDAFVGVADFDDDPEGEIVRVDNGTVHIVNHDFTTVWGPRPLATPDGDVVTGRGGPPTIADFDGDGRPEIGIAGALVYAVYDPDEDATTDDSVLWTSPIDDTSSSSTGSTCSTSTATARRRWCTPTRTSSACSTDPRGRSAGRSPTERTREAKRRSLPTWTAMARRRSS